MKNEIQLTEEILREGKIQDLVRKTLKQKEVNYTKLAKQISVVMGITLTTVMSHQVIQYLKQVNPSYTVNVAREIAQLIT